MASRRAIFDVDLPAEPGEAWAVGLDEQLEVETVRDLGFLAWGRDYVPEQRGPLDFHRFKCQLPLYGERATSDRDMVVKKATQIGLTTWLLRWTIFWADQRAKTGLYLFPTDRTLKSFSQERVGPLLQRGYLSTRVGSVNNVNQRQIGLGWVHFRGAAEAVNLESIPADVLAMDEYDSLEQKNIGIAEQRVTGPLSEGLIRRVGVPSIPGFGISRLYEKTTQHVWMVKCSACNEQQPMVGIETYAANVDEESRKLVCRKCRKPLDVLDGQWVATWPDRPTLGYWFTKFILPGIDISRIIENHHKTLPADIQTHFNRDLGEEYAPAEGRLSRDAILACTRPGEIHQEEGRTSFNLKTMGVDVASARACTVRVSEHLSDTTKRSLFIGDVSAFEAGAEEWVGAMADKLAEVAERFGVNMVAIDHLPEPRLAETLAARLPGRVFLVAYNTADQPPKSGEIWNVDAETRRVVVHRTSAIDATLEMFRLQRNLIPDLEELPPDYADQLGAVVRIVERDEKDKVKVYYRSIGPDDRAQAEVYDLMATEVFHHMAGIGALAEAARSPEPVVDELDIGESLADELGADERLDEGDWETER